MDKSIALSTLSEIMTKDLVMVHEDELICVAVNRMAAKNVGIIIVTDTENRITGVFSERDLLMRVNAFGRDISTVPVSAVMTKNPILLQHTDTVARAFVVMQGKNFRHIPIMDDQKVVGIVSLKDLNRILLNGMENLLFDNNK